VLPAANKMFAPTETRKRSSAKPGAPLGNIEKSLCTRLSVLGAGAALKPLYGYRVSPLSDCWLALGIVLVSRYVTLIPCARLRTSGSL
jgi:hypothetical protein